MKTVEVPVVIYKNGTREVVGTAVVDIEDYSILITNQHEINLNDAGLSLRKDR